ncbi:MAG TPA: hypothetical protein VJZ27_05550, partial [Aggregatilineales bacterium]|nr:hypothetical protein [Aggregatilineales bacterium]
MLQIFRQRWTARLLFALLLLIAGEVIAWQDAAGYDIPDWLAVAVIYVALGAIILDLMVRFHASDTASVILIAGVFGLAHGTLISLATVQNDNLAIDLAFRALGLEVWMFLLAFLAFRQLAGGKNAGLYAGIVAITA